MQTKMKNMWKMAAMFVLLTVGLVACDDDDDYSLGKYWISYGTVETSGPDDFSIVRDDGSRLVVVSNGIPLINIEDGQRVIANYTILGDSREEGVGLNGVIEYYVRLNGLYDVLTKAPVKQSFIEEDAEVREDSIGNDPIRVLEAWFGGKYLNINFEVAVRYGSSVKHFINLVQDDVQVHGDSVYVTLRHNGYDDVPESSTAGSFVWGFGRVSFDILSLIPEGKTSVPVKLIWTEYGDSLEDRETKSDSGTFILPQNSGTSSATTMISVGTTGLNRKIKQSELGVEKIATVVR